MRSFLMPAGRFCDSGTSRLSGTLPAASTMCLPRSPRLVAPKPLAPPELCADGTRGPRLRPKELVVDAHAVTVMFLACRDLPPENAKLPQTFLPVLLIALRVCHDLE